jgi:hypothetical protein
VDATPSTTAPTLDYAPLNVAFSVAQTSTGHNVVVSNVDSWACGFAFSMSAPVGAGASYVQFTDGEIDYRLANGATYTQALGHNDLEDWFGTDQLVEGTETANEVLSSTGPFTATVIFRYLDLGRYSGGASHTASLQLSC